MYCFYRLSTEFELLSDRATLPLLHHILHYRFPVVVRYAWSPPFVRNALASINTRPWQTVDIQVV